MELSKMRQYTIVACLVAFPLIVIVSLLNQDRMYSLSELSEVEFLKGNARNIIGPKHDSDINLEDILLGGLLASGFDQDSCVSRYQISKYRKYSPGNPSQYLISKLRKYEILHKKCEPYSESYNKTIKLLNSSYISTPSECNYIIWKAQQGLGNRILSTASAFLYALLTDKVLLVDHHGDMADLFCEPFPNTTWVLPPDFPDEFRCDIPRPTFGNLLRWNKINASMEFPPPFLYLKLAAGRTIDFFDMLFYCEDYHTTLIRKVPWLVLRADEYFIPPLFSMPTFQEELFRMFPDKETVFHHLGRYLFNPANKPWEAITSFYEEHMAKAKQRIGLQVRVFNPKMDSIFPRLMDEITTCTLEENLLPKLDLEKPEPHSPMKNNTEKVVLIASLYSHFYDNFTELYTKFPTTTGDGVAFYQASHEGRQMDGRNSHNIKAWVEMNILSFSDVLVTSSGSTFGYVAMGLGGIKSWMLARPEGWNTTISACKRMVSMEPCLHIAPSYDCKAKADADMGKVVSYIKHCEDSPWGLKLFSDLDSSI